jgi:hypothetical protein
MTGSFGDHQRHLHAVAAVAMGAQGAGFVAFGHGGFGDGFSGERVAVGEEGVVGVCQIEREVEFRERGGASRTAP